MTYNDEQKAWIKTYEEQTGFDFVESENGLSFEQHARWNIEWWESYTNDVMHAISNFPNPEFV